MNTELVLIEKKKQNKYDVLVDNLITGLGCNLCMLTKVCAGVLSVIEDKQ